MRQLGQLEMRQSRLSTHWSKPTLGTRMTIFSVVETMSGRVRHLLFDQHVEQYRVCRTLQLLREWNRYEQNKEHVFT